MQKEAQIVPELLQAGKLSGRGIIKALPCFDTSLSASDLGLYLEEGAGL